MLLPLASPPFSYIPWTECRDRVRRRTAAETPQVEPLAGVTRP